MAESGNQKFRIYEPLLIAIAATIGLLAGYNMNFNNKDYSLLQMNKKSIETVYNDGRIEEILRFIETNYVDSLDQDALSINAIRHILRNLDPHSNYISSDELQDHNERMEGKYRGIGIEPIKLDDTFYIVRVLEDSPAEKAGLKIGDALLTMNGDSVTGKKASFEKIRTYFRDPDQEHIDIKVKSLDSKIDDYTIETKEIEVSSADMSFLLDDGIAYIKLSRFSANTYEQFMRSLESLVVEGENIDIIIDLRDNPGGYLPEAIKILSQLFNEKDKLLCYTEGLNRKRSEYHSTGKTFYDVGKIVVLMNEYSASGSEILAGAIQDWDRGLVIGRSSFGKGLVQEIFPLNNGGALRLTVAKYYTPSGRLIQKSYENVNQGFDADTSSYKTKLLERQVNGGGGIDPDIYVEDPFNDYCYNYSEYVDYYLLHKMKLKGSMDLDESDLSSEELDQFILDYFGDDPEDYTRACNIDLNAHIRAKYLRIKEGEDAYALMQADVDPYISRGVEFIKDEKTTMALLTKED